MSNPPDRRRSSALQPVPHGLAARFRKVGYETVGLGSALVVSVGFLAGLVGLGACAYGAAVESSLRGVPWTLAVQGGCGLGAPVLYAGSWRARSRSARVLYGTVGVVLALTSAGLMYRLERAGG